MKLPSINQLQKQLLGHPKLRQLFRWAKSRSLPGFQQQSIYDVLNFVYQELKKDRLITRANSISFSFFLSLFPTIIAFFTLIPLLLPIIFNKYLIKRLPLDTTFIYEADGSINFVETLILQLNTILPNVIGKVEVITLLRDIVSQPRTGLLSFGFFLALFFASNGMMSMMRGFEKSYHLTFKHRSLLKRRLVAIGLLLLLSAMIFASILLIILGNQLVAVLLQNIESHSVQTTLLNILRYLIVTALIYFGTAMIYRYGIPTIARIKVFSVGTTVAAVGSILSTIIFSFYVDNFGAFNKLYGSIGTIIVVMLWIQLNVLMLLIGFELNASVAVNRDLNNLNKDKEVDSE